MCCNVIWCAVMWGAVLVWNLMNDDVMRCHVVWCDYLCENVLNCVPRSQGFDTGDGVIIVGGFYTKIARESSYAKISLGTIPKVKFPEPNKKLKAVVDFVEELRVSQHKAIFDCFRRYNAAGGRVLTLQSKKQVLIKFKKYCTSSLFTSIHNTLAGLFSKSNNSRRLCWSPCLCKMYTHRWCNVLPDPLMWCDMYMFNKCCAMWGKCHKLWYDFPM